MQATNKDDISILGAQICDSIATFVRERPEVFEKSEIKSRNTYVKHQSKTMNEL